MNINIVLWYLFVLSQYAVFSQTMITVVEFWEWFSKRSKDVKN